MDAATILRSARTSAGRTQVDLAAVAATKQPSIALLESGRSSPTVKRLDQLLAPLGCQVIALPTRLPTIASWASSLRDWIIDDPAGVSTALLRISDDLRSLDGARAVALCVQPPATTGSPEVDAALASLVEYTLGRQDLPIPTWTSDVAATSQAFYIVGNEALRALVTERTPPVFAKRNVWVPDDFFESA